MQRRGRQQPTRRAHGRQQSKGSNKGIMIGAIILGVLILGGFIWWFTHIGGGWDRKTLDDFVEATNPDVEMAPGATVYVDFSDGMQYGYGSPEAKALLASVVNKLSGATGTVQFMSLADDKITKLDMPQTEIYNTIMNPGNYTQQRAPIEKTLKTIVEKQQPALLITDFEEYNGAVIQQQNYAKDYFKAWLAKGFNITFYKLDFNEKGKEKKLFFAVFDGQYGALDGMVAQAVAQAQAPGVERFILGSPEYAYPKTVAYLSFKQGGNYHDSKGVDNVSGVIEDGSSQGFISYCTTQATADAAQSRSKYAPISELYGPVVQYYPMQVSWPDILKNIEALRAQGVDPKDVYQHFIGSLYANFSAQDGFAINKLEARAFNVEQAFQKLDMDKVQEQAKQDKEDAKKGAKPRDGKAMAALEAESPEVLDMFTASLLPAPQQGQGWQEIVVDFDTKFNGTFPSGTPEPTDMLKVNVVIAQATPRLERVDGFFGWPGNRSLAQSVTNALTSAEVNPQGQVIISYYMKLIDGK